MTDLPIMCTLGPEALKARKLGLLPGVMRLSRQTAKIATGYIGLSFAPEAETLRLIADMINAERQCCRFLRFGLTVEPGAGPIRLDVTGPEGAQAFVEALLESGTTSPAGPTPVNQSARGAQCQEMEPFATCMSNAHVTMRCGEEAEREACRGDTWVLAVAAVLYERPDRLIRIASGSVSQILCSKTFVSGLDPAEIYARDLRPEAGMGLIDWGLRYDVDHARQQVRTTVFGMFESRAIYREGFGCALHFTATPAIATGGPPTKTDNASSLLPDIAGPEPVVANDPALTRTLDQAFAEYPSGPRRWTQAVVIVHGGRVIAERYAPGYGVDTPLLSHSIAKSVINALVGILVGQGKLSVSGLVPAPSWHQEQGDPRANVTIDELLRMDSGLPLDEGVGPGLAQQMWFTEGDTAGFADHAQLATAPGTAWAYSNLGYALLSRAVGKAIGGTPHDIAAFAQRELFARLGMRHALIEFDSAGTPSGSNAMFATARDWARFGMLYLNDGMAGERRILPEGWVVYSTRPTLNTGYGAGFWLNNVSTPIPTWGAPWGMPGVPRDTFFGRGYLGQYLVIVPSENLVVVRFGVSHISGGDIKGTGALEHDVIAALHAGAASR